MMPTKTLSQHLAAVHDHLTLFLTPQGVHAVDTLLATIAQDPRLLRPPVPMPLPRPAILYAPPRLEEFPPTYFRMNELVSLVEVSPELLELLEVEKPEDLL